MHLIDNKNLTHINALKNFFKDAKEIAICVAFVKESGLHEIRDNLLSALENGAEITIYAGLDFYLTEPKALNALYDLTMQHENISLYLCQGKNATFHPKLYFVISNDKASVIIGSANLTMGGLSKNNELSICQEISLQSGLVADIRSFLDSLLNQNGTTKADKLNISQYSKKYDVYNKQIKNAQRSVNKEISKLFQLDLHRLNKYLEEYRSDESNQKQWRRKERNYRKAREILDELADANISSRKEFLAYYEQLVGAAGQPGLWHSGSLFRLRNKVAIKYKTFIDMLRIIQNRTNSSPREQFEVGMSYVLKINGLGVNVLTEILNTYSPRKCAVLNNNPISSLNHLGFEKYKSPNTFNGLDYDKYNDLIKEFAKSCVFTNLSQVDHFLNYVYWKYVKNSN